VVADWKEKACAGASAEVVAELLSRHYDPRYYESMSRNFAQFPQAKAIQVASAAPVALAAAAQAVVAAF